MSQLRDKVVELARSFIGVRWLHQGRSKQHGLDCVGLLAVIADEMNWQEIVDGDLTGYSRYPVGNILIERMDELFVRRDKDYQYKPGDLLVYWIAAETHPQHVGVVTAIPTTPHEEDELGFVHVYAKVGKVLETTIDPRWEKRIHSVYSFPAVVQEEEENE